MAASVMACAPHILDEALGIVRARRGIDFTGYRRSTLERRLLNRLIAVRPVTAAAYLDHLRQSDQEVDGLLATLTVKLSRFYRNAPVFDALRRLLASLATRLAPEPLRLWSAGCGRGEEAYSLAMLIPDGAAEIWGTDLDETVLAEARRACYPPDAFAELPASLSRFFEQTPASGPWAVAPQVRGRVRFVRHDLAAAGWPERWRFHLVTCRNVLIYFDQDLQRRVISRLIDAVVPGGLLCLGEAEWLGEHAPAMETVDRRLKIFRRPPEGRL